MCGSTNRQDLGPVQEYFRSHGVTVEIARRGSRYVLYCPLRAASSRSVEAEAFKKRMVQLGAGYNQSKPREAASFPADSFATAFWATAASVEAIEP